MVVLVANHEHSVNITYRLEGVLQAFDRCPGCANVELDLVLDACDLAHVLASDEMEVLRPLPHHLHSRSDHDDAVYQPLVEESLCD